MKFRFHGLLVAVAVVAVSCEKPEYVDGNIKLLPASKAIPITMTSVAGANALSSQDLTDIGLQLGRFPPPLGTPSSISIESSNNGVVTGVSVGYSSKRIHLVRRQGKGWRVLHTSHISSTH